MQSRPSLFAAAAVIRAWLLCAPPPVSRVSQPCASASAHRTRACAFAATGQPVQSSRFTHSAPGSNPSSAPTVHRLERRRGGGPAGLCPSRDATRDDAGPYRLVAVVEAALTDPSLPTDRARADAMRDAMAALLTSDDPIPPSGRESLTARRSGTSLCRSRRPLPRARRRLSRGHLQVVTPRVLGGSATSKAATRRRATRCRATTWHRRPRGGDRHVGTRATSTTCCRGGRGLAPGPQSGPGDGVSVHILCMTPADHPHRYWDRGTNAVLPYPFVEMTTDRWQTRVVKPD